MRRTTVFAITLILFFLSVIGKSGAQENPVLQSIADAQSYYTKGNFIYAQKELRKALKLIQNELVEKLQSFLPEAPKKWEASASKGSREQMSRSGKVLVSRKYYHDKSDATVYVEFMINSTKAATIRSWLADPRALKRSSETAELSEISGYRSIEKFDKYQETGEIYLVPVSSLVVKISGDYIKDLKHLRKFAERIDYKGLVAVL